MISKLGGALMVLGVAGFMSATAWWIIFFYDVLGQDFQIAQDCFYWTTDICALKGMVAPFADVPEYDPFLLWLSAGFFVIGLMTRMIAPSRN